jgi:uncharacterized membrane protein
MRRFDRRSFERKGLNKLLDKDEKLLLENLKDLKADSLRMSIKEIAEMVLPDEY